MLQGRSFLCEIRLIELRDFPSFRFFIGLVKTKSLLLLEKLIVTIRQVISQSEEILLSLWPVVQLFDVLILLDSWQSVHDALIDPFLRSKVGRKIVDVVPDFADNLIGDGHDVGEGVDGEFLGDWNSADLFQDHVF